MTLIFAKTKKTMKCHEISVGKDGKSENSRILKKGRRHNGGLRLPEGNITI